VGILFLFFSIEIFGLDNVTLKVLLNKVLLVFAFLRLIDIFLLGFIELGLLIILVLFNLLYRFNLLIFLLVI